jgi:energy-coupling factor transporter ATP-binding protein EcfA2
MENPFSISFGRTNERIIQRDQEIQPIFEDFNEEHTRNTVYILTGPRGCGKTVTLSHVLDEYRNKKNWVVARLSQGDDMLEQMASLLYENGLTKLKSLKVEFSFSFQGISFQVKGDKPVSSIHVYLEKLLEYYQKKGIHVLVAIDDVTKNDGMVNFIRAYQGFLIDHYDVRLLMTGLNKNISKLETDKSLTFLFRAPKIQLSPLSIMSISYSYQTTFHISEQEAISLAKFTKGYAMAYQLLGDILFRNNATSLNVKLTKEFDLKISDWSYEIIWSELTENERKILTLISDGITSNQNIIEKLNISKGNLAIYKKKLSDEGLLNTSSRGKSDFSLPRFDKFIKYKNSLIND